MVYNLTDPRSWEKPKILGEGSYNIAIRSNDGQSVLKIQKFDLDYDEITGEKDNEEERPQTDTPERSVRLWNTINEGLEPQAVRLELNNLEINTTKPDGTTALLKGVGWVCPYVEGVQASDKEIQGAVLDIFNRTGRIITDATGKKNFLRTPDGTIVCIDIGMALEMEKREEVFLTEGGRIRSNSIVSLDTWKTLQKKFNPFFHQSREAGYPKTVDTIKALLFIKAHRPDIFDVDFLKTNPNLVMNLANAYDSYDPEETSDRLEELDFAHSKEATMRKLEEEQPVTFESTKASCIHVLKQYINSRGIIVTDKQAIAQPARITQWLRDELAVTKTIEQAKILIQKLESAESLDEIETYIGQAITNQQGTPKQAAALGMCHLVTGVARRDMPTDDPNLTAQM